MSKPVTRKRRRRPIVKWTFVAVFAWGLVSLVLAWALPTQVSMVVTELSPEIRRGRGLPLVFDPDFVQRLSGAVIDRGETVTGDDELPNGFNAGDLWLVPSESESCDTLTALPGTGSLRLAATSASGAAGCTLGLQMNVATKRDSFPIRPIGRNHAVQLTVGTGPAQPVVRGQRVAGLDGMALELSGSLLQAQAPTPTDPVGFSIRAGHLEVVTLALADRNGAPALTAVVSVARPSRLKVGHDSVWPEVMLKRWLALFMLGLDPFERIKKAVSSG